MQEAIFFAGLRWQFFEALVYLDHNSAPDKKAFAISSYFTDINIRGSFGFCKLQEAIFFAGLRRQFFEALVYLDHNSAPDKKAFAILSYFTDINIRGSFGFFKLQEEIFSPACAGIQ